MTSLGTCAIITVSVMLAAVAVAVRGNVTTISDGSGGVGCSSPRSSNSSEQLQATGGDLWCLDCKESYYNTYDPTNSPCLYNTSQVVIRQCGPTDRYCKVERLDVNRQTMMIQRTCVKTCPYGCRFQGFGFTKMRCTSCCRTYGCNYGNAASSVTSLPVKTLSWIGLMSMYCLM